MSVLINGMKMPDNCESCAFESGFGFCLAKSDNFCGYTNYRKRPEWCPLVELPEPHGRLIDENNVIDAVHERLQTLQTHKEFIKKRGDIDLLGVLPYVSKIQAVIEAEGE